MAEAALTNGMLSLSPAEMGTATTHALVAYLRSEADLADEKAKRLRAQAAALSEKFGVTEAMQAAYEMDPEELPPVDENGVPKYRGKKRGRKPKPRKRQQNPNRRKRQHTAYTLFVQETYPLIKSQNPELPSKDLISIVAKQWNEGLTAEEKREWKMRAKATHEESDGAENGGDAMADHHLQVQAATDGEDVEATAAADAVYQQTVANMEADEDEDAEEEDEGDEEVDEEEEEEEDQDIEEEEEPTPPKRRRGRPKKVRD